MEIEADLDLKIQIQEPVSWVDEIQKAIDNGFYLIESESDSEPESDLEPESESESDSEPESDSDSD